MAQAAATKKAAPKAKSVDKTCSVAGCKRGYRAKGYCFFHYKKWRQGELGHARYDTCSKEDCLKKVVEGGLCETHLAAWKASRKHTKQASA